MNSKLVRYSDPHGISSAGDRHYSKSIDIVLESHANFVSPRKKIKPPTTFNAFDFKTLLPYSGSIRVIFTKMGDLNTSLVQYSNG